ncbi:DUF1461 domain-containing protein [Candidatus Woesearchaeota archaeon]|nr:DUF1461 domain-containing protein [Candidatus Woesearchaeota archaeon]
MDKELLKPIITVLIIILCISTAGMIYFSNIKSVSFDQELYEREYQKYDIRSRFPPETNLTGETAVLLDYLEHGTGTIESDFFNEKEKTHLVEVRALFRLVTQMLTISVWVSILSMFLLILSVKRYSAHLPRHESPEYYKKVISGMLIGIGSAVDAIALGFFAMAFTFSVAFYKFHELFFKTDTWLLNPATDNLIRMFPEPFFYDLFIRIILMSVVFATVMLVIGFVMKLGRPTMFDRMGR